MMMIRCLARPHREQIPPRGEIQIIIIIFPRAGAKKKKNEKKNEKKKKKIQRARAHLF